MSKTLVLELDDADYEHLLREAQAEGRKVEELAAMRLRPVLTSGMDASSQPAADASPMLNGPNSDWEQILQQFAQNQAAQHGGTLETHLVRLQASLGDGSVPSNGLASSDWYSDPVVKHFGALDSGDPHSADNERIDADIARYYLREFDGNEILDNMLLSCPS